MMLQKLRLTKIGNFNDFSLDFNPNLNIIYSNNKDELELILSLVFRLLYGAGSENSSKTENKMSGADQKEVAIQELYFRDEALNDYVIVGKNDGYEENNLVYRIKDEIQTSFQIEGPPGEYFIGCNEEQFKQFFYSRIWETSQANISRNVNDKIKNIKQCGDENLSYTKVVQSLKRALEKIHGNADNGMLSELKHQYQEQRNDWGKMNRLQMNEHDLQIQLKSKGAQIQFIEEKIKTWEDRYQQIELLKQNPDYRELRHKIDDIAALSEQKNKLMVDLSLNGAINDQFLAEINQTIVEWQELKNTEKRLKKQSIEFNRQIEQCKALYEASGYEKLPNDIKATMLESEEVRRSIRSKLIEIEDSKTKINELKQEITAEKTKLEELEKITQFNSAKKDLLFEQEEYLNKLHLKMDSYYLPSFFKDEENLFALQEQKLITLGSVLFLTGILAGSLIYPLLYLLIFLGIWLGIIGVNKKEINRIKFEADHIKHNLQANYREIGVINYEEINIKLKEYNKHDESLKKLSRELEAKQHQLKEIGQQDLEVLLKQKNEFINNTINSCSCTNLEEWLTGLNQYQKTLTQIMKFEQDLADISHSLDNLSEVNNLIESKIKGTLNLPINKKLNIEQVSRISHELNAKWQDYQRLDQELSRLEDSYQTMLKDRDIAMLNYMLKPIAALEREFSIVDEESSTRVRNEWKKQLDSLNKDIQEINNRLKSLPKPEKSITMIEQEMELTKEKIDYYEEVSDSIILAREILYESYRELKDKFINNLECKAVDLIQAIPSSRFEDQSQNYLYYLALKLGVYLLNASNYKYSPLYLFEPFTGFNLQELREVLNFLKQFSQEFQLVIGTCDERVLLIQDEFIDLKIHRF